MTQIAQQHWAYSDTAAPVRTGRGLEYDVLARITRRISEADRRGHFPDLVAALHDNSRLWTVFATQVADRDNGLPRDLRARIFYLARFTHHHTPKVLSGAASVAPLVEINTAVMRGLRGETE